MENEWGDTVTGYAPDASPASPIDRIADALESISDSLLKMANPIQVIPTAYYESEITEV